MANNPKTTRLIPVDHVAEKLGVSRATIHRWVRENEDFPRPVRLSPGCTRWSETEIDAWVSDLVA